MGRRGRRGWQIVALVGMLLMLAPGALARQGSGTGLVGEGSYRSPHFGYTVTWQAPWQADAAHTRADPTAGDALALVAAQAQALIFGAASTKAPADALQALVAQDRSVHPDLRLVGQSGTTATLEYAASDGTPTREYDEVRPVSPGQSLVAIALRAPTSAWDGAVHDAQAIILGLPAFAGAASGTAATSRTQQVPTATTASGGAPAIGQRTKTRGCVVSGPLPDPACTPGAVLTTDASQVCTPGYAKSVRKVPTAEKDAVYAEYGITSHRPGEYEVDHLISLELGGSNDVANLWPEVASPKPGFHEKDQVENYLHDQVCSGAMPLATAQQAIASNWLAIYQQQPSP